MRADRRLAAPLAIALLVAACAAPATLPEPAESELMLTGVVTRVLDGDTLVLETGLRVRLAGVNAPEADERYSSQAADAHQVCRPLTEE
ncbi:MAG TPA: hypothetical protein EYP73_03015 [Acidimicrobiia bacterium]|nr:hypothetical protein [Acidimicrobiia bacterium]